MRVLPPGWLANRRRCSEVAHVTALMVSGIPLAFAVELEESGLSRWRFGFQAGGIVSSSIIDAAPDGSALQAAFGGRLEERLQTVFGRRWVEPESELGRS